jgi:hypothetical protein
MKTKSLSLLCALAFGLASTPAMASTPDPAAITVDTFVVRPACFIATVLGSAVFVVSLPFAAISKSVHSSANSLVVGPAQATFTRPLGDLDALLD